MKNVVLPKMSTSRVDSTMRPIYIFTLGHFDRGSREGPIPMLYGV
jgi:hypothetical protein